MYMLPDGELEWHESEAENIHVEVIVCDGADHRFFPCLSVRATLIDGNGKESARMSSRPSGALPLALQAQLETPAMATTGCACTSTRRSFPATTRSTASDLLNRLRSSLPASR